MSVILSVDKKSYMNLYNFILEVSFLRVMFMLILTTVIYRGIINKLKILNLNTIVNFLFSFLFNFSKTYINRKHS